MAEEFLYFLWQYHQFPPDDLKTVDGKKLTILNPGFLNSNSGPDFSEAKVLVENISWYGQVEMHINSSDWELHSHHEDPAYNNVVLHVVWNHDQEVFRNDGTTMPVLELQPLITKSLLNRYRLLQEALEPVPCARQARAVEQVKWYSMLDRCAVARLERKAGDVLEILELHNGDWEETTYRMMMKYLGFKVNAAPMEQLSALVPYRILKKNAHQPKVVEALLFGQGGLLLANKSKYEDNLLETYRFYSQKYDLENPMKGHLWKYLRMRPANFPTLRIAQFAAMVIHNPHLFDLLLYERSYKTLAERLRQPMNDFWKTHYHFSKEVKPYNPALGEQAIRLLAINVIAPLRAAYSLYIGSTESMDNALHLLQQLPPEKNKIVKLFESMPYTRISAFDSQAMITLFEDYCSQKQCLRCDIGTSLIRR